ncbi:acetyl-CoA carboxylase biotin carboxyl carrier protein [Pseudomonas sp. LRF_L74]|uniref:acetyl-CoA carboxylase biotin carboxyl carrier protein n=1 Tax=Pseudomonas sp. LRF_L74 TaxID=3369422 RepID=UPI003F5F2898
MDQRRIKELIDLLGASDLTELTLSEGGSTLCLTRYTSAAPVPMAVHTPDVETSTQHSAHVLAVTPPQAEAQAHQDSEVRSPLYGILHLTPSPDEPAFVQVGDQVEVGQMLCIVEAMKMFHQVRSTVSGRVEALLAKAGQEVESGQPLFRISEAR